MSGAILEINLNTHLNDINLEKEFPEYILYDEELKNINTERYIHLIVLLERCYLRYQ